MHKAALPTDGSAKAPQNRSVEGFTLVEMLVAIVILTFGLLAAGQLLLMAMGSSSLARSKGSASIAAQNQLEALADLFRQNPAASDLTNGTHGPQMVQVLNPSNGAVLNRYNVTWTVTIVSDPRVGKVLKAKQVTVTVNPVTSGGADNKKALLNKVVCVSTIFSSRLL